LREESNYIKKLTTMLNNNPWKSDYRDSFELSEYNPLDEPVETVSTNTNATTEVGGLLDQFND